MTEGPWWWLDERERATLGLGTAVTRSERGVLFGDAGCFARLEIVARSDDAPVRLGPIALRVWGDASGPRARALLRGAVDLLGPRLADDFDPDALVLDPDAKSASHVPATATTLIDVPSICDRACVFCHVSLRPIDERVLRGSVDVERAIAAAGGPILFTGDDALSNPSIVSWVELAARGGRDVAVIGPPRLGVTAAMAPALARAGLRKYITALLGASEATHDLVAGRAGAYRAVREAVAAMRASRVVVELVTPLVRPVLGELGAIVSLANEVADGGHTLLAYAPDSMVGGAFDALVPPFDVLRVALASLGPAARTAVDALPLCVLPEALRSSSGAALDRSDDRLLVIYPEVPCSGCELRSRCPGLTTTVARAVGTSGLVALGRSPRATRADG